MTVHALVPQCALSVLSYFELFWVIQNQNKQNFPGLHLWNPMKRAYSASPDSPAAQRFFSLLRLSKNRRPKKIAGYATALKHWNTIDAKRFVLDVFENAGFASRIFKNFTDIIQKRTKKMR